MSSNPSISLAPNSLYIATSQIMAEAGLYHWSLYVTDRAGVATKYHWAALRPGSGKAEGVLIVAIDPVTTYSRAGVVTFGYFRVASLVTPSATYMQDLVQSVFNPPHTAGYGTVKENRRNGLTCRTWVLAVCGKLHAAGLIEWKGNEAIEITIKMKTEELEKKVAEGTLDISEHQNI